MTTVASTNPPPFFPACKITRQKALDAVVVGITDLVQQFFSDTKLKQDQRILPYQNIKSCVIIIYY